MLKLLRRWCAAAKIKVFYLLYLQWYETSRCTAPQPSVALSMDPAALTPARQRDEKEDNEHGQRRFTGKRRGRWGWIFSKGYRITNKQRSLENTNVHWCWQLQVYSRSNARNLWRIVMGHGSLSLRVQICQALKVNVSYGNGFIEFCLSSAVQKTAYAS